MIVIDYIIVIDAPESLFSSKIDPNTKLYFLSLIEF